jgi:hypothetical protein
MEIETLEYDEWSTIIDAIDEDVDWRNALTQLRINQARNIARSKHRKEE